MVIVHGYAATPGDHWFPWLAGQLQDAGIEVSVPALPDPHAPDALAWQAATAAAIEGAGGIDEHTHLVAHSLGCVTVLRHLASLPTADDDTSEGTGPGAPGTWRLGGLSLIAGFTGPLPALPQLDGYLTTHASTHPGTRPHPGPGAAPPSALSDEDLRRIAARTHRLHLLRSEHDAYVPTTATDALAARLGVPVDAITGAGHFLAADGITTLPPVLNTIIT
ncbi:alpha/beta hydrolase [Paenibacillus sp. TRM 82003]|uniref:RBBP9/YdeN family alpha/beta hydrolase n=1 Tax=Kineococcus sp. TRM81007 TaxID=2925831 RepID=UPI001F5A48F6|nr:alpha/beta fold hydrolase [Kineococcus sp. TRM81007]MCI2240450.1 alpha/beta hydrolase [Kineococcus sp. TRM81007]MCI3927373.1 alpha/beta hydrolase [Paenibacillus sp. TRM 82003]